MLNNKNKNNKAHKSYNKISLSLKNWGFFSGWLNTFYLDDDKNHDTESRAWKAKGKGALRGKTIKAEMQSVGERRRDTNEKKKNKKKKKEKADDKKTLKK